MAKLTKNKQEKLTDLLGGLPDKYVEESTGEALLRKKEEGAPRSRAGLRWVLTAAAAVLLIGAITAASVMGSIAKRRYNPEEGTENAPALGASASPSADGSEKAPENTDGIPESLRNLDVSEGIVIFLGAMAQDCYRFTVAAANDPQLGAIREEFFVGIRRSEEWICPLLGQDTVKAILAYYHLAPENVRFVHTGILISSYLGMRDEHISYICRTFGEEYRASICE